MYSKLYCLPLLMIILLSPMVNSQEKLPQSDHWINIDNELMYNIVIATDRNQKITKGLLYGMKGDSLYLSTSNNKMFSLNIKDLLTLSIEDRRTNYHGTVFGTIGGMYLGSLLFLTSSNQSAKYLEYEEDVALILYELLFAFVGGGIGYLIDRGSGENQEVFYFNYDEEGISNEINKLTNFLTNNDSPKKFHLSIHLSQVSTRNSEIQDNSTNNYGGYYYPSGYALHNFNLLRKLSLTYEFVNKLEIGIALSWFGEPTFYLNTYEYTYDPYESTSTNVTQSYDGFGYYLLVNYKPLKNIVPDNLDIILGCGIGLGKVDFSYRYETTSQNYPSDPVRQINETIIDETLFSSLFSGEIKYYIYPELTVSLQADYIYLPEKMPAIPAFGYEERNLGNFSFGFGLGVNF